KDGTYSLADFKPTAKFEAEEILWIGKYSPDLVVSAVYFDGEKEWTMVKRFQIETTTTGQRFKFISDHKQSKLYYASADPAPVIKFGIKAGRNQEEHEVALADFIDVKGWKALGNKLTEYKLISINTIQTIEQPDAEPPLDKVAESGKPTAKQPTLFPDIPASEKPKDKSRAAEKKTPLKKAPAKKTARKTVRKPAVKTPKKTTS